MPVHTLAHPQSHRLQSDAAHHPHHPEHYRHYDHQHYDMERHLLDPVDYQILTNIRHLAAQECLPGIADEPVYYAEELKHTLFHTAFALVAKPFGNDMALLTHERAAQLRQTLLYAMALDITSLHHPQTATEVEIREALYSQTRHVVISAAHPDYRGN